MWKRLRAGIKDGHELVSQMSPDIYPGSLRERQNSGAGGGFLVSPSKLLGLATRHRCVLQSSELRLRLFFPIDPMPLTGR